MGPMSTFRGISRSPRLCEHDVVVVHVERSVSEIQLAAARQHRFVVPPSLVVPADARYAPAMGSIGLGELALVAVIGLLVVAVPVAIVIAVVFFTKKKA